MSDCDCCMMCVVVVVVGCVYTLHVVVQDCVNTVTVQVTYLYRTAYSLEVLQNTYKSIVET